MKVEKYIPNVPRVTEIIYLGIKPPMYVEHVKKAVENGRVVHEEQQLYYEGRGYLVLIESKQIANQLELFIKKNNLEIDYFLAEYSFHFKNEKMEYCGTIDLVCFLKDGSVILFDYKTGSTRTERQHGMQLAAYSQEFANCKRAVVIYNDSFLEINLKKSLVKFEERYIEYLNLDEKYLKDIDFELELKLRSYANLVKEIQLLESQKNDQLEDIKKIIGDKSVKTDFLTLNWCKPRTTTSFSKEFIEQNKEHLVEKIGKPYLTTKVH